MHTVLLCFAVQDDIKLAAKRDNQAAVKILAKQLVQVRNTQVRHTVLQVLPR